MDGAGLEARAVTVCRTLFGFAGARVFERLNETLGVIKLHRARLDLVGLARALIFRCNESIISSAVSNGP